MKKIKELLKRLETALLKQPWVFENLSRFRNYLTKILIAIELFHITAEVEASIASWPDDEVLPSNKVTIRRIMDTVLKSVGEEIASKYNNTQGSQTLTYKMKARLNLAVTKAVVTQLTRIIGVQPMQAPVSQLFMMRYKTEEDATENGMRKMTLEIVAQAVEATSRRLQAGFTLEAMQDMRSMHKLDIEDELTHLLANEISGEIIGEVVADLLRLGTPIDISELKLVELSDTEGHEAAGKLMAEISKAASNIAFRTRRGAGNYIIVPPHVVSMLQARKDSAYKQSQVPGFGGPFDANHLIYVGDLFGTVKVYMSLTVGDQIIVGYKGGLVAAGSERKPHETDAGYFLAPYLPAISGGIATNPVTFQPLVQFMTRYGKAINTDRDTAQEYYRVIKLDPLMPTPVAVDLVSEEA